jgi:hypothetical protein
MAAACTAWLLKPGRIIIIILFFGPMAVSGQSPSESAIRVTVKPVRIAGQ